MLASVLSHFDSKVGPRTLLQKSELPPYIKLDHISLLMDFYSGDFFIHEFGDLKSANHIFSIPSPIARGNEETLMISIIALDEKVHKLQTFHKVLEIFVQEFKKIKDAYKGLHDNSEDIPDSSEKLAEINGYFENFFDSLPKEKALFKQKISRILIFGLPQSGKTTIIECLQQKIFNKSKLKKEINLRKSLLGNLSITTYNFSEKNNFYEVMSLYLENIDGMAFVLDVSDIANYKKVKNELHQINKFASTYHLPLAILLNKIDLESPKITEIKQKLKVDQLKHKSIKFFPISALKNDGITDAFNWLSTEITNTILKNPIVFFS